MEDRGRYFRNLILGVISLGVTSIAMSFLVYGMAFIFGIGLFLITVAWYLFLDTRRMRKWGDEILLMYRDQPSEYMYFLKNIASFRQLPPSSLYAMLAILPTVELEPKSSSRENVTKFGATVRTDEMKILLIACMLTVALWSSAAAIQLMSPMLTLVAILAGISTAVLKLK